MLCSPPRRRWKARAEKENAAPKPKAHPSSCLKRACGASTPLDTRHTFALIMADAASAGAAYGAESGAGRVPPGQDSTDDGSTGRRAAAPPPPPVGAAKSNAAGSTAAGPSRGKPLPPLPPAEKYATLKELLELLLGESRNAVQVQSSLAAAGLPSFLLAPAQQQPPSHLSQTRHIGRSCTQWRQRCGSCACQRKFGDGFGSRGCRRRIPNASRQQRQVQLLPTLDRGHRPRPAHGGSGWLAAWQAGPEFHHSDLQSGSQRVNHREEKAQPRSLPPISRWALGSRCRGRRERPRPRMLATRHR